MTVYVDDQHNPYGGMSMCHMFASTLAELHEMADKIGIDRKWFQPTEHFDHPHYDVCQSKKVLALKNGALFMTARDWVKNVRAGHFTGDR